MSTSPRPVSFCGAVYVTRGPGIRIPALPASHSCTVTPSRPVVTMVLVVTVVLLNLDRLSQLLDALRAVSDLR